MSYVYPGNATCSVFACCLQSYTTLLILRYFAQPLQATSKELVKQAKLLQCLEQVKRTWSAINVLRLNSPLILCQLYKVTFWTPSLTLVSWAHNTVVHSFLALHFDVSRMSLATWIAQRKRSVLCPGHRRNACGLMNDVCHWLLLSLWRKLWRHCSTIEKK